VPAEVPHDIIESEAPCVSCGGSIARWVTNELGKSRSTHVIKPGAVIQVRSSRSGNTYGPRKLVRQCYSVCSKCGARNRADFVILGGKLSEINPETVVPVGLGGGPQGTYLGDRERLFQLLEAQS